MTKAADSKRKSPTGKDADTKDLLGNAHCLIGQAKEIVEFLRGIDDGDGDFILPSRRAGGFRYVLQDLNERLDTIGDLISQHEGNPAGAGIIHTRFGLDERR